MTRKGTFGSLHPRTLNLSFKLLTYGYAMDSLIPFFVASWFWRLLYFLLISASLACLGMLSRDWERYSG